MNAFRERLADNVHETWSRWMKHLIGKCKESDDGSLVIPAVAILRWRRQLETPYVDLPDHEKESDRIEADRILKLIELQKKAELES